MMKIKFIVLLLLPVCLFSQSIVNTVHNLSISGPGEIKATSESEICIFCHTPHNSSPLRPLWNRNSPGLNYILYNSSTIQAAIGQPDGASICVFPVMMGLLRLETF